MMIQQYRKTENPKFLRMFKQMTISLVQFRFLLSYSFRFAPSLKYSSHNYTHMYENPPLQADEDEAKRLRRC